jgi:hypothetical protein
MSSRPKGAREYRYYRCSGRNNNGSDACRATNAAAAGIEDYVATKIIARAAGVLSVQQTKAALDAHLERRRKELELERAALPAQIAAASAKAAQYLDEMPTLQGRAREIAQERLMQESERLGLLEDRLASADQALTALAERTADVAWVAGCLRDFGRVWSVLNARNRKRLLGALVEKVVLRPDGAEVELALSDVSDGAAA